MNYYLIIGIGVIIIAGVFFFGMTDRDTGMGSQVDFDRFASASLTDYEGNNLSLEKFRGTHLSLTVGRYGARFT